MNGNGNGYAYGPPGGKEREARGQEVEPGCCCTGMGLDQQMSRYTLVLGCVFAAVLGPYSGVLCTAAISGPDPKLHVNSVSTVILFLLSLGLIVRPNMRILSRLWLLAGLAWVLSGWVTYFRKEFSEMPERWLVVTVVQSCVFGILGFLPLFTTDPLAVAIFT